MGVKLCSCSWGKKFSAAVGGNGLIVVELGSGLVAAVGERYLAVAVGDRSLAAVGGR